MRSGTAIVRGQQKHTKPAKDKELKLTFSQLRTMYHVFAPRLETLEGTAAAASVNSGTRLLVPLT